MKKFSFRVVILAMLSATMCIAANLISGRLGNFGLLGFAPLGVFFFPFVFIISDVTSEVYGYRVSRWVAWLTSLSNIVFIGMILLTTTLVKPAPFTKNIDDAIRLIMVGENGLGGMLRIMIAGLLSSVIAGWVNDIIFQYFRNKDGIKSFTKRKLLSSLGAEMVDTSIFITLAFIGTPSFSLMMYIVQFALKYTVEVLTEPIAKIIARKFREAEGEEAFENRNEFTLFGTLKKKK